MARWLAVLALGFVAGAATVMLADPGARETRTVASPVASSSGNVDGNAGHDHSEDSITYEQLPARTKAEVDEVIAAYATKYATGADANKDGWFKATKSLYGIGAHYVQGGAAFTAASTFDLLHPNIMLFDGEGPDAKFAGVSYVVAEIPTGFTGDYDSWHRHSSVCLDDGTVVSLGEERSPVWLSDGECMARGGRVLPLGADQMMHLWIGPGYMNGTPIFAHDNPKLYDGYNPKRDG